jgi:hypothetical protein
MAKANLNSQAKRKRELAKKDKRAEKDQKRAQRKAEARTARATPETATPALAAQPAAQSNLSSLAAAAFIRRMNKTP